MKNRRFGILAMTAGLLWTVTGSAQGIDDRAFSMDITFAGYEAARAPLTNFPALVVFRDGSNGVDFADFEAGAADLRFTDAANTTELNYEIEIWDDDGASWIWVQMPELEKDTVIVAHWGKLGASAPTYAADTWSEGFRGVWHLDEIITDGGTHEDSTSYGHDGTFYHADGDTVAGTNEAIVGRGVYLTGATDKDDYTEIPYSTNLNPTAAITLEVWAKNIDDDWDASSALIKMRADLLEVYKIAGGSNKDRTAFYIEGEDGATYRPLKDNLGIENWHHWAGTFDGTAVRLYCDGVEEATVAYTGSITNAANMGGIKGVRLGADWTGQDLVGWLDEARISGVARSTDWLWASWKNQASSETFAVKSEAERTAVATPAEISTVVPSSVDTTSAMLSGYLSNTGSSDTVVFVFWGTSNGETNRNLWANTNTFPAPQDPGFLSTNVTLVEGNEYFYRFAASNDYGIVWATNDAYLISSPLTVSVDPDTVSETYETATFTFSRPDTLTGMPLTVNFTTNGTAAPDVDYQAIPALTATIPAAAASATVTATTLPEKEDKATETLTLGLAEGAYAIGASSDATLTITSVPAKFTAWARRMELAFSGYPAGWKTLNNFPALVVLRDGSNGVHFADFQQDAADLRFTDWSFTRELNYEIETWNDGASNAWVWVQVPELEHETVIYAYWNKSNVSAPDYTTNGATWSEGYGGVWHLDEIISDGGIHEDSTANGNHGTFAHADGDTRAGTNSIVGRGVYLADPTDKDDHTEVPHDSSLNPTEALTVSAWVRHRTDDTWDSTASFLKKRTAGYQTVYQFQGSQNNDRTKWDVYDSEAAYYSVRADNVGISNWRLWTGTYDGSNVRLYVDGVEAPESPTAFAGSITNAIDGALRIGGGWNGDGFDGFMDEVRISGVPRSQNWVWACWFNQASNTTFVTQEEAYTLPPLGTLYMIK